MALEARDSSETRGDAGKISLRLSFCNASSPSTFAFGGCDGKVETTDIWLSCREKEAPKMAAGTILEVRYFGQLPIALLSLGVTAAES